MTFSDSTGLVILYGGVPSNQENPTWLYDPVADRWREAGSGASPGTSISSTMVYAPDIQKAILFGGRGIGHQNETWLYDDRQDEWTNADPPLSPPDREYHGMAYDAGARRVVLFGGAVGSQMFGDTWLYDPGNNTWSNATPAAGPSPRASAAMAFDPGLGRTVLFGGADWKMGWWHYLDDSWLYDLANNSWIKTNGGPSWRVCPAVYDAGVGKVRLFGGFDGRRTFNDLWTYDSKNASWKPEIQSGAPSARSGHALAFDSKRSKLVLFGGQSGSVNLDDTWILDPSSNRWSKTDPQTSPGPRQGLALAHDPTHRRTLLFGGWSPSNRGPTWLYDQSNNSWAEVTGGAQPTAGYGPEMTHVGAEGKVVLFGGYSDNRATWLFDFSDRTWSALKPSVSPPGRQDHALAYDSVLRRVLLYGGNGFSGGALNDTWVYDVENNSWSELKPLQNPGRRYQHSMAFDRATGRFVLHGGYVYDRIEPETWLFDLRTGEWSPSAACGSPGRMMGSAMTYDSVRGRVLLYGVGGWPDPHHSLWEYDGANDSWRPGGGSGGPGPREGAGLTFDELSGRAILFGGSYGGMLHGDTWLYTPGPSSPSMRVAKTLPRNGELNVSGLSPVVVKFDRPLDEKSVASALLIYPDPGGGRTQVKGDTLTWTHSERFASRVRYTLMVTTAARGLDGSALASNCTVSFTTGKQPPRVISTMPPDGAHDVARNATITVRFNSQMDPNWTARAFRIEPAVAGGKAWVIGSVLYFTHTSIFQGDTRYRVTLSWTAQDGEGTALGRDHVFGFTTAGDRWPTWLNITTPGSPDGRHATALSYDEGSGKVVLFGGAQTGIHCPIILSDTWTFEAETRRWTESHPPFSPTPRNGHAMVYDPVTKRTVMFGGFRYCGWQGPSRNSADNETWAFDAATDRWENLTGGLAPSPRFGHSLVALGDEGKLLLFGGAGYPRRFNDLWVYHTVENRWENITTPTGPSPRAFAGAAYHEGLRKLVIYGGSTDKGTSNETWTYDVPTAVWELARPSGSPGPRDAPAMAYHPGERKVILYGDSWGYSGRHNETWYYDVEKDEWNSPAPTPDPGAVSSSMVYASELKGMFLFTGQGWSDPGKTWLLTESETPPEILPGGAGRAIAAVLGPGLLLFLVSCGTILLAILLRRRSITSSVSHRRERTSDEQGPESGSRAIKGL
ncbi:MAG TPA: kelch repeat-containing protein [Thermoplasmata archaeon]|nr:kelch repeat-containing protein [Thermoplasmata archaeon]